MMSSRLISNYWFNEIVQQKKNSRQKWSNDEKPNEKEKKYIDE